MTVKISNSKQRGYDKSLATPCIAWWSHPPFKYIIVLQQTWEDGALSLHENILAAVWRIDWRNWERNEESRRKLLESSQVKLGDHLDWGGGSEMAQRRQIWEVAGRSDGLGSGLGLVGEWKGGVKDDLRFLVYKIGWWYLLWWRTMDGSQFCGENIRSSVRYMTAPISWN